MINPLYRVIDANFNRCREAFRVMEEYCRFGMNSELFSSQAKNMRHRLSAVIKKVDQKILLLSRDSISDVGRGLLVQDQLVRTDLKDCFTAAAKRASEALRALAEAGQSVNAELAAVCEQLRFEVYTFEKEVFLFAASQEKLHKLGLYVLIPAKRETKPDEFETLVKQCINGGASCLQLRAKQLDDNVFYELAERFVSLCKDGKVLSIINDRTDIAAVCGADGVHLGQNDLNLKIAKKLQINSLLFGLSTHCGQELEDAIRQGVNYVGLGKIFPTMTKPEYELSGCKYVKEAVGRLEGTGIYHTAIGGITLDNVQQVIESGAKSVAVCSEIVDSDDPESMCRSFVKAISAFLC